MLFFGGRMSHCAQCVWNGRGDVWKAHRNRSDYLLYDTASSPTTPFKPFYVTMPQSQFCLSPLGHDMGDTDRYSR